MEEGQMITLWTVAAYSLQIAAIVTIALAAAWALGIRMPRHALRFWQTIMAIALLLPLAQPRTGNPAALRILSQSISPAVSALSETRRAFVPAGLDGAAIILTILAAGIVARLLWLAIGLVRLRSIVTRAEAGHAVASLRRDLAQAMGAQADVRITDDLDGPATVGVRRPLVLLPRSVLAMSTPVQRAIICHELLHVKRRDWVSTIAEELWCALLWFNPLARIIASRLSLARETVVDEATILITRDRRAYAEALLAFSDPQPHVVGVTPFIGRRTLSQRISLIASEDHMSHRRAIAGAALALTAVIAITAAAVDRFPMFTTLHAQSTVYDTPDPRIKNPEVVHEVKPVYTAAAMQEKIQGSVWMRVVVGADGDVTDVQVTRSLDAEFGLDQEAMTACWQWKFKPAVKDGQPVAVRVTIEMTFTLKK